MMKIIFNISTILLLFLAEYQLYAMQPIKKSNQLVTLIDHSIPNTNDYKQLFYDPVYTDKIKKIENKILKTVNRDETIVRYVFFSDQLTPEQLNKYSGGLKSKSMKLSDIPNTYNVDSINKVVFPVFPAEVYWLILNSHGDGRVVRYIPFYKTNKRLLKKSIKLKSDCLKELQSNKFTANYRYNIDGTFYNYITLVSILDMQSAQSFWVQGIESLSENYMAINPKDQTMGFKKQRLISGNFNEKNLYQFNDYDRYTVKIANLLRIIISCFYKFPGDDKYFEQFYRNF